VVCQKVTYINRERKSNFKVLKINYSLILEPWDKTRPTMPLVLKIATVTLLKLFKK